MRGLNRLTGRPLDFTRKTHDWHTEMRILYDICQEELTVPGMTLDSPHYRMPFEMREVEGGLCEFDKYSRIHKGEGRTRSVYNYSNIEMPIIEDLDKGESRWGNSNNT